MIYRNTESLFTLYCNNHFMMYVNNHYSVYFKTVPYIHFIMVKLQRKKKKLKFKDNHLQRANYTFLNKAAT